MAMNIEHVIEKLTPVIATHAFRDRFPIARLLRTPFERKAVCETIPPALLPFMIEELPQWPDIYAFDLTDPERDRVVVWSDHAVVAEWNTLDEFLNWIRSTPPTDPAD